MRYPCNVCTKRFATDRGRKQHEYNCAAKATAARKEAKARAGC